MSGEDNKTPLKKKKKSKSESETETNTSHKEKESRRKKKTPSKVNSSLGSSTDSESAKDLPAIEKFAKTDSCESVKSPKSPKVHGKVKDTKKVEDNEDNEDDLMSPKLAVAGDTETRITAKSRKDPDMSKITKTSGYKAAEVEQPNTRRSSRMSVPVLKSVSESDSSVGRELPLRDELVL